jgi:phage terminase large subunit GpA-like protein
MLRGTRFRYKRADGREIFPVLSLVDSGAFTDTVYAFCRERTGMYPSKGFNYLKKNRDVVGDQMSRMDISRYRKVNAIGDLMLVLMSTNFYKATFYTDLHNTYKNLEDRQNNWGFCEFPADYSDEFFQQLTAEERRLDGSFHNPGGKPNEALDLRVMNLCAGDLFIDNFLDELKAEARRQKLPQHEIEKINHKIVLERLKQLTRK